jgi:hypothetical protein
MRPAIHEASCTRCEAPQNLGAMGVCMRRSSHQHYEVEIESGRSIRYIADRSQKKLASCCESIWSGRSADGGWKKAVVNRSMPQGGAVSNTTHNDLYVPSLHSLTSLGHNNVTYICALIALAAQDMLGPYTDRRV